jgi:Ca2+-binding RTX toxin-like protein
VTLTDGDITGIEGIWFTPPPPQGGSLGVSLTIAADLLAQLAPDFIVKGSGVFGGVSQVDGLVVEMAPGDSVDLSHIVLSDWDFTGPDDDYVDVHGSDEDDTIVGSSASADLIGNDGADTITGGSHDDWLTGGDGADILAGGGGADAFVYNFASESGDTVVDFLSGVDRIEISAAGFGGGLTEGAAALFISGDDPESAGSGGQFLYHNQTGELYWDADGDGANDPALLATLLNTPALQASDIFVTA